MHNTEFRKRATVAQPVLGRVELRIFVDPAKPGVPDVEAMAAKAAAVEPILSKTAPEPSWLVAPFDGKTQVFVESYFYDENGVFISSDSQEVQDKLTDEQRALIDTLMAEIRARVESEVL